MDGDAALSALLLKSNIKEGNKTAHGFYYGADFCRTHIGGRV